MANPGLQVRCSRLRFSKSCVVALFSIITSLFLAAPTLAQDIPNGNYVYGKALQHLSAAGDQPFIEYHRVISVDVHGSVERKDDKRVVRTADGMTAINSGGRIELRRIAMQPDAWLRQGGLRSGDRESGTAVPVLSDATENGGLQVIAVVTASFNRDYAIKNEGIETLSSCGQTYHLVLTPRHDPDRLTIREMWVSSQSWALCKSVVLGFGPKNTRILFTQTLDNNQMIASETGSGTMHLGPFMVSFSVALEFDDIRGAQTAPDNAFPKPTPSN